MEPLAPQSVAVPFSLFERDQLHRLYTRLGMSRFAPHYLLKRCVWAVLLTWVPMAVLAWVGHSYGGGLVATNFFADFAAYAQLIVAMPLFVIADPIIDSTTRNAAHQFFSCNIIPAEERPAIYHVHARLRRWRTAWQADAVCIVIAYLLALAVMAPEFGKSPMATWHVRNYVHYRTLTPAGFWESFVALPVLNYTWLRFVWKILLWIYYLRELSRTRLLLRPTHADLVGGLGFVSQTQGQFAIVILAYGISNVAATIGYEITILHYAWSVPPVWGPLLGFTIGAPALFTLPLLMFTRQLYRSKRRALALYRQRVSSQSQRVEMRWLAELALPQTAAEEIRELTELSTLSAMFSRI